MTSEFTSQSSQYTSQGTAQGAGISGSSRKEKLGVGNRADLDSKVYGLDYDALLQERILGSKTVAKAAIFDKEDYRRVASSDPPLDASESHIQALLTAILKHQRSVEGTEDRAVPGGIKLDGEEWEVEGSQTDKDLLVGRSKENAKRHILLGQSASVFLIVITKVLEDNNLLESIKTLVRSFEQGLSQQGQ